MVTIKKGPVQDSLILKGRDVAFELKDVSLDPRLHNLLIKFAEIQHTHAAAIADMATMFEQMMDVLVNMTQVQGSIKDEVDRFRRKYAEDDPAPDVSSFPNQERDV